MDLKQIQEIIDQNSGKNFVSRIIDPSMELDNRDGTMSTHSMSYGESGGKFFVFPTVIDTGQGYLKRLNPNMAFGHAFQTGEFIEFDSEEDASSFSEEYKKTWEDKINSSWE